jgi:hypothetical protein
MSTKPTTKPQKWFCVEDCTDPRRPVLLMTEGDLRDCHHFIESCRRSGRKGVYRVNYSPAMRHFLKENGREAA